MEDSKQDSVGKALDALKLKFRIPRLVVCDKGSSLEALSKNKDIMSDLSCRGVELQPSCQLLLEVL